LYTKTIFYEAMRSIYTGWLLTLLLGVAAFWPTVVQATHVRAGEVTVRRLPNPNTGSALTYEITLTTYYDIIGGRAAAEAATDALFCFGDGTRINVPRQTPIRFLNAATTINIYKTTYTYGGPGAYTIVARIINRNGNTLNYNGGVETDAFSFKVSTTILANDLLGLNSNPILLNPPVDTARVGQRYCHNPAAFDPDGDSLSYRMSVSQGLREDGSTDINSPSACLMRPLPGYVLPNVIGGPGRNEAGTAPASFSINPRTGDVCWDTPTQAGQYIYAFVIQEWREGVLIGEITRDVQVIVIDGPNRRPIIDPLTDICAEAGTLVTKDIRAVDPDGHRIVIQGFGGPFNRDAEGQPLNTADNIVISPAFATLTPGAVGQASPATSTFRWQTNCLQLREEPYQITIRANDQPPRSVGSSLVSYASFQVQLVGPRPENLTARAVTGVGNSSGRAIQLNWNPYTCLPRPTPATQQPPVMLVFRREGCDQRPTPTCQTGILSGYVRVGTTSLTATTFTDTTGLRRGVTYTYRLVAQYPLPVGGESLVSAGVCLSLPLLAPVLTQVTVDSTGPATGRNRGVITVRWSRPIGLNPADGGGPFEYRLSRATGLTGTNYTQVTAVRTTLSPTVVDTFFVDRGSPAQPLDTEANAYTYRLEFFVTGPTGQLIRQDLGDPASSVRLGTTPGSRQVTVTWQAQTPWTNDNQTHRVFRSRRGPAGPFNQIAEVRVQAPNTYQYVDNGTDAFLADGNTSGTLSVDTNYCYRVETVGQYADATIRARTGIIRNFSQIQCASPIDTVRPCPPALTLDLLNCATLAPDAYCNQTTFTNTLNWTYPAQLGGRTCDPRIASYNIYYARYEGDSLRRIGNVPAPTTTFLHQNLTSVAGCYIVTAVNIRGTESLPSNRVCKDICPYFALPNIFTPNGDGKNDLFQPLRCPRFVETVSFVVFNRWGAKVYESVGPTLAWNGQTSSGQPLPGGMYYYECTVRFAGLSRSSEPLVLKGYAQLIRDSVGLRKKNQPSYSGTYLTLNR
jgi:gliding motility-associated-like protein